VRLLLDVDLPTAVVGRELVRAGHDIAGLDLEPALDGLSDDDVLALAEGDGSILVTANVSDYPRILRAWLGDGRSHAGVILVRGPVRALGAAVARTLEQRPGQEEWRDRAVLVDPVHFRD